MILPMDRVASPGPIDRSVNLTATPDPWKRRCVQGSGQCGRVRSKLPNEEVKCRTGIIDRKSGCGSPGRSSLPLPH